MDITKYRDLFFDESREHLAEMSRLVVDLEIAHERDVIIAEIFRHAHSLKSMAAAMGYDAISVLSHHLEDALGASQQLKKPLTKQHIDVLLQVVDGLREQVNCVGLDAKIPPHLPLINALSHTVSSLGDAVNAPTRPVPILDHSPENHAVDGIEEARPYTTMRVRVDLLEEIMDSVGELFIVGERLKDLFDTSKLSSFRHAMDKFGTRIRQLHSQVIAARMSPVRTLTDRYPRLVRDLCRTLEKEAEVTISGKDIEVDRAILDNLDMPFVHILRNAVDHGIEMPAQRKAAGKSPVGQIVVSIARERDSIAIEVTDDGAGIDIDMLKHLAVKRSLMSEMQAQALNERQALQLIFLPGFSTKDAVSATSGRGVGMDAVAARIKSMGGSLEIRSEFSVGTAFLLRLPLTLAIIPVLLVRTNHSIFAVPTGNVLGIRERENLRQPLRTGQYIKNNNSLQVDHLGALLHLEIVESESPLVVIVETGHGLHGIEVDSIVGYREVVVKPLGEPLDRLDCFTGATILGDGQPVLILDVPKLIAHELPFRTHDALKI